MKKVSTYEDLKRIVKSEIETFNLENPVITVDGFFAAGKTKTSEKICHELGYKHVPLDYYLNTDWSEDKVSYEDYKIIKYPIFNRVEKIFELIQESTQPVVLDGAFLEEFLFLEKRIVRNLAIYIKRMAKSVGITPTLWLEEGVCDCDNLEEKIEQEKNITITFEGGETKDASLPPMREELMRYHYRYRPHRKADIIYENEHIEN